MSRYLLKICLNHVRNKVLKQCDFHMGARSIGHRSDTLTTHVSNYKNHMILDNTILNKIFIFLTTLIVLHCHLLALSQWEKLCYYES